MCTMREGGGKKNSTVFGELDPCAMMVPIYGGILS